MNADLFWRIPSTFDIEKLVQEDPPSFLGKKKSNLDNFYYLIDHLLHVYLTDDLSKSLGFVELFAYKLQENTAHNYKDYLSYLVKHNLIQRAPWRYKKSDPLHGINGKAFGYRLNLPGENNQDIKLVPIVGEVYKKQRKPLIKQCLREQSVIYKKYPVLSKWFEHLEIDVGGCRKWLDSQPDYQLQKGDPNDKDEGEPQKQLKRLKALYAIDRIQRKDFHFLLDDKGGRFHSNLTNLKSELRNFLSWKGQKLVNIDIKNSQPLLSLTILDPKWYQESSEWLTYRQFLSIPNPYIQQSATSNTPGISYFEFDSFVTSIMIEEFLQLIDNEDINKYKEIVNSGEFYKRLHEKVFKDTKPFVKEKVKEMTFQILYSHNRFLHQNGNWVDPKTKKKSPSAFPKRLFKKLFPSVFKVFEQYKYENKSFLAILLQQIESTLILKHIVPRIASERPDLPIFTIHDSVVTLAGDERYVEQVMREEIMRLTGLTPKFGIERWEPQYQSDESVTE
jgi:hypothetical protein